MTGLADCCTMPEDYIFQLFEVVATDANPDTVNYYLRTAPAPPTPATHANYSDTNPRNSR